jgi:hypothetical protein
VRCRDANSLAYSWTCWTASGEGFSPAAALLALSSALCTVVACFLTVSSRAFCEFRLWVLRYSRNDSATTWAPWRAASALGARNEMATICVFGGTDVPTVAVPGTQSSASLSLAIAATAAESTISASVVMAMVTCCPLWPLSGE